MEKESLLSHLFFESCDTPWSFARVNVSQRSTAYCCPFSRREEITINLTAKFFSSDASFELLSALSEKHLIKRRLLRITLIAINGKF